MVTTDDELKAAKEAEAIIATLSSSTHSAKETVNKLRKAYQVFAAAQGTNFSSGTKINDIRHDTVLKLQSLCAALEKGPAAQETIDAANFVVKKFLKAPAGL
jgi:hypothetical protein